MSPRRRPPDSAGSDEAAALFEAARPRLRALAYRMLGSAADAEDAVQDTWLRWQGADRGAIEVPEAWLTTACTRRCIDLLRAARRSRVDYVGPWLPEPVVGVTTHGPADTVELAASLSTAFLLLLERLSPAERAAYLLHDLFEQDYPALAATLRRSEESCRQLVSRARKRVGREQARFRPDVEHGRDLLAAFLEALRSGASDRLSGLLAEDVQLWSDGGGKISAVPEVVEGAAAVAGFLRQFWEKAWRHQTLEPAEVNGGPGLLLREDGRLVTVLSLAFDRQGRIAGLYAVRNPDKLGGLD